MWARRKAEGWVMPQSQKDNLAGRKFSEETRERMSASQKKRCAESPTILSNESRKKISDKVKAMWADPEKKAARLKSIREAWAKRLSNKCKDV